MYNSFLNLQNDFSKEWINYYNNNYKRLPIKNKINFFGVLTVNDDICPNKLIKQYLNFKIPKFKELIFEKNDKILKSDTPINTKRLIFADKFEQIIKNLESERENKIIKNLRDKLSMGIIEYMNEYEKLTPYEKMDITEKIKKYVNPCYHDFYSSFTPMNILYELENNRLIVYCKYIENKICFNIKFPIKNNVSFKKNIPLSQHSQQHEELNKEMKIFKIISFLYEYVNYYKTDFYRDISSKPLCVHIFMGNRKKQIDYHLKNQNKNKDINIENIENIGNIKNIENNANIHIGPNQTNSAYCLNMEKNTKIVGYRSEEINKLSIHEFMHGIAIEGNYDWETNKNTGQKINEMINIYHYCNGNGCTLTETINEKMISGFMEGYVDFCADIINSIFYITNIIEYTYASSTTTSTNISTTTSTINKNNNEISEILNVVLSNELEFSIFQVAKLLTYFGINKYEDVFKIGSKNKIYQSTNVFSYFVIRSILLLNIEHLIDIISQFKTNSFIGLFALKNKKKAEEVNNFIVGRMLDPNFCLLVNNYIDLIHNFKPSDTLLNTMRRSVFSD
jgi:hypothetical protein